ncbi:MAG: hypothetical protein K6E50_00025 [Lachnospiraceae bacterium]|nr:hypothetical protein [Lachnospiraceae bacterium]
MREDIRDAKKQKIGSIDRSLNGRVVVYNKMNNKLGEIRPNGNYLVAYDKNGRKMAQWYEKDNCTYDNSGRKIAKGNILLDLYFQG